MEKYPLSNLDYKWDLNNNVVYLSLQENIIPKF